MVAPSGEPGERKPGPALGANDRYVTLDRLGEGGMAVVYAAFDRALDRKVAVKVLKDQASADADARLRREAQALARLKHPNVVTVYDVGRSAEGTLFVAMEFMEGGSLREWLAKEPRSRAEVMEKFLQAGEGLAAAHEAGLVHRDFKPDNVLLTDGGVARVGDFGLARVMEDGHDGDARTEAPLSSRSGTLTRTGSILGTPFYMAPEQLRGDPVSAPADQFAFGVALYEALAGARPFRADSLFLLLDAIEKGPPAAPRDRVPAWLGAVLARSLAVAEADRFPSMRALLSALRADPTRRRTKIAIAVALLGAAAAGAAATYKIERDQALVCEREPPITAAAWNEERRAAMEAAFESTGLATAAEAARATEERLSTAATAIDAAQRSACESSRVRHEQTPAVLELRMACLHERVLELDALVSRGLSATREFVNGAVPLAAGLRSPGPCADVPTLTARGAPPSDAAARVEELRGRLARYAAGIDPPKAALAFMEETAAAAEETGYLPLRSEAQQYLGVAREEAGNWLGADEALHRAYNLAEDMEDDRQRVDVALQLTFDLGRLEERFPEAHAWLVVATAAAARAGDPVYALRVAQVTGDLAMDEKRHEDALASYLRVLEIARSVPGYDNMELARAEASVGNALSALGKIDEGLEHIQRAMSVGNVTGQFYTPPYRAYVSLPVTYERSGDQPISYALLSAGHPDPALALLHGDLEGKRERYGDESSFVAAVRASAARALVRAGRTDAALAQAKRAAAIVEKTLPPGHPKRTEVLAALAYAEYAAGDYDAAATRYAELIPVATRSESVDNRAPISGTLYGMLCWCRLEAGHPELARLPGLVGRMLPHDPYASAGVCTGLASLALHEAGAERTLEESLDFLEHLDDPFTDPFPIAVARFALAQAVAGRDEKRGHELAARAARELDGCDGEGGIVGKARDRVKAWLAAHR